MRVLLVEDDELIGKGIVVGLRAHGIDVSHASTAQEAETLHLEESFQAMVLDMGLPDRDGMDLLSDIRVTQPDLPVLILTARDAIEHKLKGLHAGADDYMIKPFDLRELAARLHALMRRAQGRATQVIRVGPLRLEPESGLAWLNDQPVALSRREVDLLAHLADAHGRWVSPSSLSDRIYGSGEEISSNALSVHIHHIRRKLGSDAIETSRGLGYRMGWGGAS